MPIFIRVSCHRGFSRPQKPAPRCCRLLCAVSQTEGSLTELSQQPLSPTTMRSFVANAYHPSGIFGGVFLQAPTTSNSTNRELPRHVLKTCRNRFAGAFCVLRLSARIAGVGHRFRYRG